MGGVAKALRESTSERHPRVVSVDKHRARDKQLIRQMKKHIEFRGIQQE